MAQIKITRTANNGTTFAAVIPARPTAWGDYVVKFSRNGSHSSGADYHTDSRTDAQETAQAEIARLIQQENNKPQDMQEPTRHAATV